MVEAPRTGESSGRLKPTLRIVAGYLIAAICLAWIFHDVRLGDLFRRMRTIHWGWVLPAIALDILSYVTQGIRLRLLLRPIGELSTFRTTQAVYAGLFTSEMLPLRAGEVVRAYLTSRWMSVRMAAVVPALAAERLFDGIWLALYIGIAAIIIPIPSSVMHVADVLGIIILAATVICAVWIMVGRRIRILKRIDGWIRQFTERMRAMARTRSFYSAFAITSLILIWQALAFWMVMRAYGLLLPVWAGAIVLLIVYLGTAIPNAPGNIGSYQFFVVVGLAIFGVEKTVAAGFSVVVFVILTIPLWGIGSIALGRSGIRLSEIRHRSPA
jgi:glycosyltransferase 2 family protein